MVVPCVPVYNSTHSSTALHPRKRWVLVCDFEESIPPMFLNFHTYAVYRRDLCVPSAILYPYDGMRIITATSDTPCLITRDA